MFFLLLLLFCEFYFSVDEVFVKIVMFMYFTIFENKSETELKMNKQKEEAFVTFQL